MAFSRIRLISSMEAIDLGFSTLNFPILPVKLAIPSPILRPFDPFLSRRCLRMKCKSSATSTLSEENDKMGGFSSLEDEFVEDLLGGCVVIHGKTKDGTPLKFIPYFLWGNRGPSQMVVWVNSGN